MPKLQDFVARCDWVGALTLLEFQRRSGDETEETLPWVAYCAYHLGDFRKATDAYSEMEEVSAAPRWLLVPLTVLALCRRPARAG